MLLVEKATFPLEMTRRVMKTTENKIDIIILR